MHTASQEQLDTWESMTEIGLQLFPVRGRGGVPKSPAFGVKWQEVATDDMDQIAQWGKKTMAMGVSCAHSRLLVVDIDTHGSTSGFDTLGVTYDEMKKVCTYSVATPSGGEHLYFRLPLGVRVKNSQGKLAVGVDVRGFGGYVVAGGSVLDNLGTYALSDEAEMLGEISDAPDWLIAEASGVAGQDPVAQARRRMDSIIERALNPEGSLAEEIVSKALDDVQWSIEGERRSTLRDAAFGLTLRGLLDDELAGNLMALSIKPGFDESEAFKTIKDAHRDAMRKREF